MQPGHPSPLVYVLPVLILLPLIYFRMRRMMGSRPLKLDRLWLRPAFLFAIAAIVLFQFPPHAGDWDWLGPALILGAVIGWYWGKTTVVHVDPKTSSLMGKGTPMAAFFLVGIVVLRLGLRGGLAFEAHDWKISAALITDGFMLFALALYVTRTAEIYLRARRLLAGSDGPIVGGPR